MIYEEKMNAAVLIQFFKRLIEDADRKIFIILERSKNCLEEFNAILNMRRSFMPLKMDIYLPS